MAVSKWIKHTFFILLIIISTAVFGWPAVFKEGVTISKPSAYFQGYTLFAPNNALYHLLYPNSSYNKTGFIYLIDMQGHVVHSWKTPGLTWNAKLLPNGNLVAMVLCEKYSQYFDLDVTWAGCLYELDWNGKTIFEYKDPQMTHDFQKTPSGNYIYFANEAIPAEVAKKVHGGLKNTEHNGKMYGGVIREINPQGKIVWQWRHYQHINYNDDIIYPFFSRYELSHFNSLQLLPNNKLLVSSRQTSQVFLIDKKTGQIIKRYGSPMHYDSRTKEIVYRNAPYLLGGQHSCSLLDEKKQNLLCYNNNITHGITQAIEINMKTNKVNWYFPKGETRLDFSYFMGGTQRLPNNNTLIAFSQADLLDEVTSDGKIVWQYVIPQRLMRGEEQILNAIRYPLNYCPQLKSTAPLK